MRKRRKYSEEYRRVAVGLADQPGVTLKESGEELGTNPLMIGRCLNLSRIGYYDWRSRPPSTRE